ncbi:unnamed protein product [Peniophora sp. CBMAI 1063]|nr:unnamed protein product [Peniophora sp. CBMAI 1063]
MNNVKAKIQDKEAGARGIRDREHRKEGSSLLCATATHILRRPAPEVESTEAIDNVKAKIQDKDYRKEASRAGAVHILFTPTPETESSDTIGNVKAKI